MNRSHRLITVFGNVLPKLSCLIRLLGSPCSRDTETVSRLIDIEPSHKDLQQGINAHLREFNNNKLAEPTSNTPKRTRKNSCTTSACLMPSLSKHQSPSSSLILSTSSLLVVCIAACKLRYAP